VDREKPKQTTTAHVVKATIKIQKGESDSSESSDSDVPAKKPIKVFKKQAAAPKQNVLCG
jgi:hypothetical protein